VKRELLNIEGGKIKKGNNVIFDDLSLELFQGEITGIVFDDICPSCLEYLKNILQDFINDFGCIVVLQKRQ
jgi:ABC-type transporter Mla maintaining outer membrane lipid asymmetry ATPase subunit MlaF